MPGTLTRVPSARGTRAASAWQPAVPRLASFQNPPLTQEVCRPARQNSHTPQEMANGAMTKSPLARVLTSEPTSVTTPISSCPMVLPPGVVGGGVVGVQVAAADAGAGDLHQGVGGFDERGVGCVGDADVAGARR